MHRRYLIGGIGNQLFQIATAPKDAKFSTIFLGRVASQALRWSHHDALVPIKDRKKLSNIRALLILPIMAFDCCLAKLFGASIATDFDLNFVKCDSILRRYSIGYFQDPDLVVLQNISSAILMPLEEWGVYPQADALVLHIRGGDALLQKNQNIFSEPNISWLRQQLEENHDEQNIVTVVTNDQNYAERLLHPLAREFKISFKANLTIQDTLSCALRSKHFIGSHSTLSFWICVLRQSLGRSSSIPDVMMHDFLRVSKSG